MSLKELQEKIVANLGRWQEVELQSVEQMDEIISKTKNPFIAKVMEIIRDDSKNHHAVQQLIIDTLTTQTVTISPADLGDIWDLVETHIKSERRAEEFARISLESVKGTKMVAQEYLLEYLLKDEEKHDALLENLEKIKKGLYPGG